MSASHLSKHVDRGEEYLVSEVRGVLVHELTHSYQWSVNGVPGGLIEGISQIPPLPFSLPMSVLRMLMEGIADFVRLRAGLAPSHWKTSPVRKKWDQGYEVTAYFLEYIDREVYPGFVAFVNEWIGQQTVKDGKYDEEEMFAEVMPGWDWDILWEQYLENYSDWSKHRSE